MRLIFALLIAAFPAAHASADPLTIDLPGGASANHQTVTYACSDSKRVTAEYINAGANSLAILKLGDETVLAVTVLSGSGAKYVGQQYVWWTKGDQADLYDQTKGEDAPPLFSCTKAG